ncbi:MAG: hypothetical protein WCP85_20020 [Mariniphaga sp.]
MENKIVLEPKVEGLWMAKPLKASKDSAQANSEIWDKIDTTSTWTIKQYIGKWVVKNKQGEDSTTYKAENFYVAKLSPLSDSTSYDFKVVLFRVNNALYADFSPRNKEALLKSKLAANSFMEVHTLARVSMINRQMKLSWLGADCMKEMIEKKRVRVNYHYVNEVKRLMLTASSEDLTKMIERYGDQPRFINWDNQQAKLELNHLN